jgi:hypothetical protein
MPVTADKPAPYTATKPVLDIIERHRNRGLPSPVDADVLIRAQVPESLIPRTLQALVSLDLIDDEGRPTQTFENLRLAPEAEFKKRMGEWLKSAYADIFAFVDPATDDETQIRDAFRTYNPVGQQGRMVILFIGLCTAAGLMAEKTGTNHSAKASIRASSKMTAKVSVAKPAVMKFAGGAGKSIVPPVLVGLLESLPNAGEGWTAEERAKFLKAFEAMLDFSFPVRKATEQKTAAD